MFKGELPSQTTINGSTGSKFALKLRTESTLSPSIRTKNTGLVPALAGNDSENANILILLVYLITKSPMKPQLSHSNDMKKFTFDLMDALRSPIITFSTSWADCIPKRIKEIIPMARMLALHSKEEMATLPEVSAYIYTRSLESPMSSEWVNIYLWASCTVCETYFKEDRWQELSAQRQLSQYEESLMNNLRRWIYEKRRKAVKITLKEESAPEEIKSVEEIQISKEPLKQLQLQFEF